MPRDPVLYPREGQIIEILPWDGWGLIDKGVEWNYTNNAPSYVVHPPLGKWLIGFGEWAFGYSDAELLRTREWLRSKGNSIEGGTSEIQLNIVAKRILGLPG